MKGQKSRSGGGPRIGFEGGQLPIIKALPMRRGFTNIFKTYYALVKLETLDQFESNETVTPEVLAERGYIRNLNLPVKIVGGGELTKRLTVVADKFTRTAREGIEAANGTAEEVNG
jgi:large subunit ribosomal protein L15